MIFGLNALFTKPAQSLAPILILFLLKKAGYQVILIIIIIKIIRTIFLEINLKLVRNTKKSKTKNSKLTLKSCIYSVSQNFSKLL